MLGTLVFTVHKSVLSPSLHPRDCPIDNLYGLKSGLELSSFIDPSTSLGGTDSGSGDLAGFAQPVNASKLYMPLLTNQVKNKNPTPPRGEMKPAIRNPPNRASAIQRGTPSSSGKATALPRFCQQVCQVGRDMDGKPRAWKTKPPTSGGG